MTARRIFLVAGGLALLFALAFSFMRAGYAVPATPSPVAVAQTAPVVLDGRYYRTPAFRVWIPPRWTVVKLSAIGQPQRVAFVAPNEAATILISTAPITEPAARRHRRRLNGQPVYAALLADAAPDAELLALWEAVLASLAP